MYSNRQDLNALIGSRICHDLVSPLGAINNGLELLAMSQQETSPEFDLIAESVASANSKIRFFRIAFGHTPKGSSISQPEIVSILKDYFAASRLTASWKPLREIQRYDAKLIFLAILCMESAMPFGGAIEVHHDGNFWVLSATCERLRANPAHWQLLDGAVHDGDLAASHVHFGLLARLARWRKPTLRIDIAQNDILISL